MAPHGAEGLTIGKVLRDPPSMMPAHSVPTLPVLEAAVLSSVAPEYVVTDQPKVMPMLKNGKLKEPRSSMQELSAVLFVKPLQSTFSVLMNWHHEEAELRWEPHRVVTSQRL